MKVRHRKRIIDVDFTTSIRCFITAFSVVCILALFIYLGKNMNTAMASTIDIATHINETSSKTEINTNTNQMEVKETVSMENNIIEPFDKNKVTVLSTRKPNIVTNQPKTINQRIIYNNINSSKDVALESPKKEEVIELPVIEEKPTYYLGYEISNAEKEILCRIVEAEVTGGRGGNIYHISDEEFKFSKFRVARVILNRIKSQRFKTSTVESTVFAKNQFSPTFDGRYYKVKITDLTREAVDMALDASIPDDIPGGTFFCSGKSDHTSNNIELIMIDGVGHKFYRYKNWEADTINK